MKCLMLSSGEALWQRADGTLVFKDIPGGISRREEGNSRWNKQKGALQVGAWARSVKDGRVASISGGHGMKRPQRQGLPTQGAHPFLWKLIPWLTRGL